MTFNLTIPGPGVAYEQVDVGTENWMNALAVAKSQAVLDQLHTEGYLASPLTPFPADFVPNMGTPNTEGLVREFFGNFYYATQEECDKINAVHAALTARSAVVHAGNGGTGTFTSVDATTLKFKPALHQDAYTMAVELLYCNGTDSVENITNEQGTITDQIYHWNRVAVAIRNLTLNVGAFGGHDEVPRVVIDRSRGFLFGQRPYNVGGAYYPLTMPEDYDPATWELLTRVAGPTDEPNVGYPYASIISGDELRSWFSTSPRIWYIDENNVVTETTTDQVTDDWYLNGTAATPEMYQGSDDVTYVNTQLAWFDGTNENFGVFHPEDFVSYALPSVTAPKIEDAGEVGGTPCIHHVDISDIGLYYSQGDTLSNYFVLEATLVSGDARPGMGFQYDDNAQVIDPDGDQDFFHNARARVIVGTTDYDNPLPECTYSFTLQNVDPITQSGGIGPISSPIEITFAAFDPADW